MSGFPTLTGTVSGTGEITNVYVNGFPATITSNTAGSGTFGTGTWSKIVYDLSGGTNNVAVVATDSRGQIGTAAITLNRISYPLNTNVALTGTGGAEITFSTDLSETGGIAYGTGLSSLTRTLTGTSVGRDHRFALSGLSPDTEYFFQVYGISGEKSVTMHFHTPKVFDVATLSGAVTALSSAHLGGATATGATFLNGGTLFLSSLTASGASLSLPFSGLRIGATGTGSWDGVIQAPEITSLAINSGLTGYAFIGTPYRIGNPRSELSFSGQVATVTIGTGGYVPGETLRVFSSVDQGASYAERVSCVVNSAGYCVFSTNRLSLFALARAADVVPFAFSFPSVTNAEPSTPYVSEPIVASGISGQTVVTVTGGEYSVNGQPFGSSTGTVNAGDSVVVRVTSAASFSANASATLNIGGVSGTFTVTTRSATSARQGMAWGGGGGGSAWATVSKGKPDASGARAIEKLVSRGAIDKTFFLRPKDPITRAEFVKLVVRAHGWTGMRNSSPAPFADVRPGHWYASYVSLALSKGLLSGTDPNFRPYDPITRSEAMRILAAARGDSQEKLRISRPNAKVTRADILKAVTSRLGIQGQTAGGTSSGTVATSTR